MYEYINMSPLVWPYRALPGLEPSDHAADARACMQTYSHLEFQILLGLYSLQLEQHAESVLYHRHGMILFCGDSSERDPGKTTLLRQHSLPCHPTR